MRAANHFKKAFANCARVCVADSLGFRLSALRHLANLLANCMTSARLRVSASRSQDTMLSCRILAQHALNMVYTRCWLRARNSQKPSTWPSLRTPIVLPSTEKSDLWPVDMVLHALSAADLSVGQSTASFLASQISSAIQMYVYTPNVVHVFALKWSELNAAAAAVI